MQTSNQNPDTIQIPQTGINPAIIGGMMNLDNQARIALMNVIGTDQVNYGQILDGVEAIPYKYFDKKNNRWIDSTILVGRGASVLTKLMLDVGDWNQIFYLGMPKTDVDVFAVAFLPTAPDKDAGWKLPAAMLREVRSIAKGAARNFGLYNGFVYANAITALKYEGSFIFTAIANEQSRTGTIKTFFKSLAKLAFVDGVLRGSDTNTLILLGPDAGREYYGFTMDSFAALPEALVPANVHNSVFSDWGIAQFNVGAKQFSWFTTASIWNYIHRQAVEIPIATSQDLTGEMVEMDLLKKNDHGVQTLLVTLNVGGTRKVQGFAVQTVKKGVRFNAVTQVTDYQVNGDIVRRNRDTVTLIGHHKGLPTDVENVKMDKLPAKVQQLLSTLETLTPDKIQATA